MVDVWKVLPHRRFKKKPLLGGGGIIVCLFLFGNTLAAILAAVSSIIGFFVYAMRLRRQQRQLQQALQGLDLVRLTNDGKVGLFLYLRSFRMGRSTVRRRMFPGDQTGFQFLSGEPAFHFEEDISTAIYPYGLLMAIGDRGDSYGACKITPTDVEWKDHFHWLATNAWMIFVHPDVTQSVKWEIGELVGNLSYMRKTVWVMPFSGGDEWANIRDGLRQDIGLVLPQHKTGGGMFRFGANAVAVPVVPKFFVLALLRVLEQANRDSRKFDATQVWQQVLIDELDILFNDKVLRGIRKKILRW